MKKLLFILMVPFAFACGNGENTTETTENNATTEEGVDIGSGENINPQLELESEADSAFDVDTVSSATEIDEQIEQ